MQNSGGKSAFFFSSGKVLVISVSCIFNDSQGHKGLICSRIAALSKSFSSIICFFTFHFKILEVTCYMSGLVING